MLDRFVGDLPQWLSLALDVGLFAFAVLRYRHTAWGRLVAAGAGLNALASLFWRLVLLLFFGSQPPAVLGLLNGLARVIKLYGSALIVLGVASIPALGSRPDGPVAAPGPAGKHVPAWKVGLLLPLTLNVYWLFWLHRTVRDLRAAAPGLLPFTPGQAVAYLVAPVYNLYWFVHVFRAVGRSVARLSAQVHGGPGPMASVYPGGAVALVLLVSFSFNALGARSWIYLVLGEALLVTALVYSQAHLNHLWRNWPRTGPA